MISLGVDRRLCWCNSLSLQYLYVSFATLDGIRVVDLELARESRKLVHHLQSYFSTFFHPLSPSRFVFSAIFRAWFSLQSSAFTSLTEVDLADGSCVSR